MNRQILAAALAAALMTGPLLAHATTAQQDKMKTCNASAGEKHLSGDARKQFMSECLSKNGGASSAPANAQQEKMKTCNAEASQKQLKGDARNQFMSSCLKAH